MPVKSYQSEAELENQLIKQLNEQDYASVELNDYDALLDNFRKQFCKFNAIKLNNKDLSDKEWERLTNYMLGNSVFDSAKILRDKYVLERDDGTKVYVSFIDEDHTKNIYQVTHQTTVVGKYVNRYDVTLLCNGLPLVQIELKRRGMDLREAVNQIMRYKNTLILVSIDIYRCLSSPMELIQNTLQILTVIYCTVSHSSGQMRTMSGSRS